VQVVEILLKADEVEGKKWKDQKLLLEASEEGDVATVRKLLESGDLDVNGVDEVYLLHSRGCDGTEVVLRMLVTYGWAHIIRRDELPSTWRHRTVIWQSLRCCSRPVLILTHAAKFVGSSLYLAGVFRGLCD
jgi:hypothetical protein